MNYRIIINKDDTCTSYTVPKESLRLLAYSKMQDIYGNIMMHLESEKDAIEFLNKIGVTVKEI